MDLYSGFKGVLLGFMLVLRMFFLVFIVVLREFSCFSLWFQESFVGFHFGFKNVLGLYSGFKKVLLVFTLVLSVDAQIEKCNTS